MDFETDIQNCLTALARGGVIIYPTDTVWGIGCDPSNPEAVKKVYEIKKRPDEKAMIVLAAEERDVLRHTAAADLQVFDYIHKSPKPVTVVYEGAIGFADNLVAADGSIAIRICRDPFCRQLIKRFRKPIVSTSANISGEKAPAHFGEISNEILRAADYTVKHRQDDLTKAVPSSVIRWKNGEVIVLRP